MSEDDAASRFARLRERIEELRRYSGSEPNAAAAVIRKALEDLQRALEELRVIEEEFRLQNDELMMARRSNEELRRRYRQLFEFVPDGCLVTDMAGNVREANAAAAALLGVRQESLLGKSLVGFVSEPQKREFRQQLATIQQREKIQGKRVDLQPAGRRPLLHSSISVALLRDEQDRPAGLQWMIREIGGRAEP